MNMNLDVTSSRIYATEKACKYYTLFVALLPIFATYASGVPGFSLADIILAAFCVYAISHLSSQNNRFCVNMTSLYFGMFFIVLFDLIALIDDVSNFYNIFIRTVRYFFYLFCFLYTSKKMICVSLLEKYVVYVSIAASGYIVLQFLLFNLFDIVVKGFIPWLKLYVEDYGKLDYLSFYSINFRPTSFFLEPAHYARYAIFGLILILWNRKMKTRDFLFAIFISIGILISTSSQGYVLLAMIWLFFLLFQAQKNGNNTIKALLLCFIVLSPVIIYGILQLPVVKVTLARSLSGSITDANSAIGARLGGLFEINLLPALNKIFGKGFGVIPDKSWMSSAFYFLYGSGIIVFAIYLIFMLRSMIRLKGYKRIILVCVLVLFFSDDSFYSYMCILSFSLALLTNDRDSQGEMV